MCVARRSRVRRGVWCRVWGFRVAWRGAVGHGAAWLVELCVGTVLESLCAVAGDGVYLMCVGEDASNAMVAVVCDDDVAVLVGHGDSRCTDLPGSTPPPIFAQKSII